MQSFLAFFIGVFHFVLSLLGFTPVHRVDDAKPQDTVIVSPARDIERFVSLVYASPELARAVDDFYGSPEAARKAEESHSFALDCDSKNFLDDGTSYTFGCSIVPIGGGKVFVGYYRVEKNSGLVTKNISPAQVR